MGNVKSHLSHLKVCAVGPTPSGNELRNLFERIRLSTILVQAMHAHKKTLPSVCFLHNHIFYLVQMCSSNKMRAAVKRAHSLQFTHHESQGLPNIGLGQPEEEETWLAPTPWGSASPGIPFSGGREPQVPMAAKLSSAVPWGQQTRCVGGCGAYKKKGPPGAISSPPTASGTEQWHFQ